MTPGQRRLQVFTNLLNGLPVERIMEALKMSAKEVDDDFRFVVQKVRSYRFERGQPLVPCDTVANARANRVELLYTASRLNLDKDPRFSRIETLNFEAGGRMSPAEAKLIEMQAKAATTQR